jgi:hypothetical protein
MLGCMSESLKLRVVLGIIDTGGDKRFVWTEKANVGGKKGKHQNIVEKEKGDRKETDMNYGLIFIKVCVLVHAHRKISRKMLGLGMQLS